MEKINIVRYSDHPSGAQGLILYDGAEGPWSIIVDKRGLPHLWLRTKLEDGTPGYVEYAYSLPDGVAAPHELVDVVSDAPTEEMDDAWADAAMVEYDAYKKRLIDGGHFDGAACYPTLAQGAH